jgi:hypothetical protein
MINLLSRSRKQRKKDSHAIYIYGSLFFSVLTVSPLSDVNDELLFEREKKAERKKI